MSTQVPDVFIPRCPKCRSRSIGLETDPKFKDKYVICVTCSHRIFGEKIDKVFSEQYAAWQEARLNLCALPTCVEADGKRALKRENSKYCSDRCRVKNAHIRERKRLKEKRLMRNREIPRRKHHSVA